LAGKPEHRFGGPWTEVKLDAVEYYLKFYTQALKGKPSPENPFVLWYIDAFAGTGDRATEQMTGGLFEGTPAELKTVRLAGSATRALRVTPAFQKFVFIEQRPEFCAALDSLKADHPQRDIVCVQGDANEVLPRLFGRPPWTGRRWGDPPHRAVVFLDPYNLVEWSTLEGLAATKAVDLWLLFPIASVLRQAARSFDGIDANKATYLDRAFGTSDWRTELYRPNAQAPLLAGLIRPPQEASDPRSKLM
jgi:three-Cys-motif partner protein